MESRTQNLVFASVDEDSALFPELIEETESMLRAVYKYPRTEFERHRVIRSGELGVLTGLAALNGARRTGIWLHEFSRLDSIHEKETVIVKRKASDTALSMVASHIAGNIHPFLTGSGDTLLRALNLLGASRREAALYNSEVLRATRVFPHVLLSEFDESTGEAQILMENLENSTFAASRSGSPWDYRFVDTAVRDIARVHALSLGNSMLTDALPLAPAIQTPDLEELLPLWLLAADLTREIFGKAWGEDCRGIIAENLRAAPEWTNERNCLTHSIIHNDFGPRNILFRLGRNVQKKNHPFESCIFDWELAALGPPVHDIAELLIFVMNESMTKSDVLRLLEVHREIISGNSTNAISYSEQRRAFAVSLRYLLANRLSLSALSAKLFPTKALCADKIIPPLRNWWRLFDWFESA